MSQKITAFTFDATQVKPSAPMEAIPAGWYNAALTDGEVVPTTDGAGLRMKLEWTVLDGPCKGRKVFDGLNVRNNSAEAQRIAQEQLSAICHAVGVYQFQSIEQLFNKPHQILVNKENVRFVNAENEEVAEDTPGAKRYEARNNFKGAKAAVGSVATPGAAAAAPGGSPWPGAAAPAGPTPEAPKTGKKPGRPAKPKPPSAPAGAAAAPAADTRLFWIGLEGAAYEKAYTGTEIAAFLQKGMPGNTQLALDGTDKWADATTYACGQPQVAANPTPAATPGLAAASGEEAPPWGN